MAITLWFMGRPASGKSTLAKRVEAELGRRRIPAENLDGDEVRQNLHPDLGFTREERALNNRRTAFVCKLLNRNDVSTVTAMITPFRDAQRRAREIVQSVGTFVLVYVKCPVEVAAERDPKGLYEQAKAGEIENFTGINHPFQKPRNPDVTVDTAERTAEECVEKILSELAALGVFEDDPTDEYRFALSEERESEIKSRLEEFGYLD